jgi:hypothetical protein
MSKVAPTRPAAGAGAASKMSAPMTAVVPGSKEANASDLLPAKTRPTPDAISGGLHRKNSSMAFGDNAAIDAGDEAAAAGVGNDNEMDAMSAANNALTAAEKSIRKRILRLIGGLGLALFRRVYRIVVFALLCRYTFAWPFFAMVSNYLSTKLEVYPVKTYQVRLKNSRLDFYHAAASSSSSSSSSSLDLSLHVKTSRLSSCTVSLQTINGEAEVPVFDGCVVSVMVEDSRTPPLRVITTSSTSVPASVVSAAKSETSPLNISSLTIVGNYVDVNMRGVNVMDKLHVEVGSGDISLVDVNAGDEAQIDAITGDGNVLVLVRRQFQVDYANYDNAICLSAPDLEILSEVCDNTTNTSAWSDEANATASTPMLTNCRGRSIMRGDNVSDAAITTPPPPPPPPPPRISHHSTCPLRWGHCMSLCSRPER